MQRLRHADQQVVTITDHLITALYHLVHNNQPLCDTDRTK